MSSEYRIHSLDATGLRQSQVVVDFNPTKYNRKPFTGEGFSEEDIDKLWQKKLSENSRIFNASKFRLCQLTKPTSNATSSEQCGGLALLKVGLSCYKDMIGTHHNPNKDRLSQVRDHGYDFDDWPFSSSSMGIGVFPVTTDGYVPLIRRSAWTAEAPNKIDRVGGHPEPDQAFKRKTGNADSTPVSSEDLCGLTNKEVLEEIFDSPRAELRDEVNIPYENQGGPLLLGEVRDVTIAGRVALDFVIHLNLDKKGVKERYGLGEQAEADESTELIFVNLDSIVRNAVDEEIKQSMAVHLKGGMALFRDYLMKSWLNV